MKSIKTILVSEEQGAFVQGRQLMENALIYAILVDEGCLPKCFLILLTVERKHGRKARPGEVAMPMPPLLRQSGFHDRATPLYLSSIFELSLSKSM